MVIKSINPFNNKELKSFPEMTDEQIEDAINKAYQTFQTWKNTPFSIRSQFVHETAARMRREKEELAKLVTLEMGKLIGEARSEIDLSADILDYFAQHAEEFLQPEPLKVQYGEAYLKYEPLGLIFSIQPFNFPFYQMVRIAAPTIMAGNTLILKHAPRVPQCAMAMERLFREAGTPEGVYTNLLLSHERIQTIIENPKVAAVSLTGSEGAGKNVATIAGKVVKKTLLELGGNDPFIVLDDADIEKTVHFAVWAKMLNMGQCCAAAKRFIVLESVADEFIRKLSQQLSEFHPGNPLDEKTTLAPLCDEKAVARLQEQVDQSLAKGAKVLIGGKRLPGEGAFFAPTLLVDIKPGMPAYDEEFFGPVAIIFRVKNEEEAIRIANDSMYGLGAAVFSNNLERAKKVAAQIESGMVFINHPTITAPELPFGGIKRSGYGRELHKEGILEFVNKKLIRIYEDEDPSLNEPVV